jgi:hypothetical protein
MFGYQIYNNLDSQEQILITFTPFSRRSFTPVFPSCHFLLLYSYKSPLNYVFLLACLTMLLKTDLIHNHARTKIKIKRAMTVMPVNSNRQIIFSAFDIKLFVG